MGTRFYALNWHVKSFTLNGRGASAPFSFMDYRQINWIASYPKSGNTWVRCFLDAYFINDVDLNQLVASCGDDNAARCLPGDGSDPSKYPIDVQMLTRPMGMLRLVRQYNLNNPGIPLFVKTHSANMVANGVELLPEPLTKSVIYIVRDPRDVIISFAKHMGVDIDKALEYFSDKYRTLYDDRKPKMADFITSWASNVRSYANADTHNVKVVRYEDMKSDPVKVFMDILSHAGVSPDKKRVQDAVDMVELDKLKALEEKTGFKESSPFRKDKFFGKGLTGGWKNELTPVQLNKLNKECGALMKRFGYLEKRKAA